MLEPQLCAWPLAVGEIQSGCGALAAPSFEEAPAPNIQPEVMTMFIREGAATIAAALVRKTAIQFVRLVSLYHTIAGMSYCCADQPLVLVFTAILSAVKLALSLRQRRNRPDFIRKTSPGRVVTRRD